MNTQKLLMNPISNRILLFISKQKEATTLEVVNAIKDVSRATLYRYMKEMVEKNILEIVREEKVKGQIQKVYKVKTKIISDKTQADISAILPFPARHLLPATPLPHSCYIFMNNMHNIFQT